MARKQTMKVYHGLPSSVTDKFTVYNELMDGKLPDGFTKHNYKEPVFSNGVTGAYISYINGGVYLNKPVDAYKPITVDLWLNNLTTTHSVVIGLQDENGNRFGFQKASTTGKVYFTAHMESTWRAEALVSNSEIPTGTFHIRYVADIANQIGRAYINGKLIGSTSLSGVLSKFSNFTGKFNRLVFYCENISDLHISNIDRGDYFPNLPQDFIDGKATIRPRMSQQQIKGDPMYGQATTLKVPCFGDDGKYYDLTSTTSDGYTRIKNNPECYTKGSYEWKSEYGAAIKIKGLNDEIIGGIVDSDTAIARVTKVIESRRKCVLSSIAGLAVGDSVRFSVRTAVSPECIIGEIDSSSNTVTLAAALEAWDICEGYYMVESTQSSSSPIVKAADGTIVVGTWSGLGTNEATFALGSNSSLSGKDLYVEYSLNMPVGNSDFPELPYSINKVWGENGVEMKPVSAIEIFDDFKYKTSGSAKECPHISRMAWETTLKTPNLFSQDNVTTSHYANISVLDGTTLNCAVNSSGRIPQQLFVFDLIEMIERKLGCSIPNSNKAEWIRDNYERINVKYTGYGTHSSGSLVKVVLFNQKTNTWMDNWLSIDTNYAVTKSGDFAGNTNFNNLIPDGKLYILAYTNASDGVTASNIFTDYISVRIDLKMDSTYTAFYCENTRAREDKCNPVLIQKETKTVKRYLPSRECFATECKSTVFRNKVTAWDGSNIVYKSPVQYATTQGTGSYTTEYSGGELGRNCIGLMNLEGITPYLFNNEDIRVMSTSGLKNAGSRFTTFNGECYTNGILDFPKKNEGLESVARYMVLNPSLSVTNGEIQLKFRTGVVFNGAREVFPHFELPIPNRPLIK